MNRTDRIWEVIITVLVAVVVGLFLALLAYIGTGLIWVGYNRPDEVNNAFNIVMGLLTNASAWLILGGIALLGFVVWQVALIIRDGIRWAIAKFRNFKARRAGRESFRTRGIGRDTTPGCFICGGRESLYNNISGFVEDKAAGERVVAMFRQGARLDYRSFEPKRVQVKIGACDLHRENLEDLDEGIRDNDYVITRAIVRLASI